ncbi:MAG: hypothetical protein ACLTLQ_09590 [[Clostridium] scindens]
MGSKNELLECKQMEGSSEVQRSTQKKLADLYSGRLSTRHAFLTAARMGEE